MGLTEFVLQAACYAYHSIRETYYGMALDHIGPAHPDASTVTAEMLRSRLVVRDLVASTAQ